MPITCPKCGMTSHSPMDTLDGYCGNCKEYTSPPCQIEITAGRMCERGTPGCVVEHEQDTTAEAVKRGTSILDRVHPGWFGRFKLMGDE